MDETNLIQRAATTAGRSARARLVRRCSTPGFVAPKHTYPVAEGSCSGIAVVRGVLYVACERGQRLYREVISGTALT